MRSRSRAASRTTSRPATRAEPPDGGQRALSVPPDQVTWFDLHEIARTDPDRVTARWEEIKRAALEELLTGHRAARAVDQT